MAGAAHAHQHKGCEGHKGYATQPDPADGPRQLQHLLQVVVEVATGKIAERAHQGRPDDSASRVIDQERTPVHPVHSGKKRGPDTQERDEATKEDSFGTMLAKKLFGLIQMLHFQKDIAPETLRESP